MLHIPEFRKMSALRKTGPRRTFFTSIRLTCIGILMLSSGTRPFAMPLQVNVAAAFADCYKSSWYALTNSVGTKINANESTVDPLFRSFARVQSETEKQLYSAYYRQTSRGEKRKCTQWLQRFYYTELQHSFGAKDTAGVFYYMEQIKLIKLMPHFLENERHHPITIAALKQQLLVHNLQYLNYVETDSVIYVLLVKGNAIVYKKIEFAGYQDTLKAFMEICADKLMLNRCYNRYAQMANLLYKKLFAPMQISPGRLLIAQGETFLPFEALTIDSEGNDFLLYHYSISYAYTATWYFRSRHKPAVTGNGFLGIAPEYYSQNAAQTRLFGAVESLEKIENYFSIHNRLTWNTASKKDFLQNAEKYSILHVYTHAAQHNGQQVLYMYDNPVDSNDIASMNNLPLQLVFLAACETAVAGDEKNEAGYSLADHFIDAGVPAAVATLWRTETQTMYTISELFYHFLEQGLSKDEALQQAKVQFIKKEAKPNQLPYYWACVVLLGDAEPLMPPAENTASFYLAAFVNISLCAVWRILERKVG